MENFGVYKVFLMNFYRSSKNFFYYRLFFQGFWKITFFGLLKATKLKSASIILKSTKFDIINCHGSLEKNSDWKTVRVENFDFLFKSYCLDKIDFKKDDIVVDCGANVGELFFSFYYDLIKYFILNL